MLNVKQTPQLAQIYIDLCFLSNESHRMALRLSVSGSEIDPFIMPLDPSDIGLLHRTEARCTRCDSVEPSCTFSGNISEWFLQTFGIPRVHLKTADGDEAAGPPRQFMNVSNTLLLISLPSLRSLSEQSGLEIERERFRANLEVELEPPFAETEWQQGLRIVAGPGTSFEVARPCVRCQAVNIMPGSVEHRAAVLSALANTQLGKRATEGQSKASRGPPVFGVLLRPCSALLRRHSESVLEVGASIEVCPPDEAGSEDRCR